MSKWISVKDRLPARSGLENDESEYVLVYEVFEQIAGGDVAVCGFTASGWDEYDNFGLVNINRITHWMPLPEPPEEDGR